VRKPNFYLDAPIDSAVLKKALTNMTNLRTFLSNVILPKVKEGHYQVNMESFSENQGSCEFNMSMVESSSNSIEDICGTSACMVGFGSLDVNNFPSEDMIVEESGKYYFNYLDFNRKYFSMINVFLCNPYYLKEDDDGDGCGEVIETLWDYTFGQDNENDLEAGIERLDYAIEVIDKQINAI